LGKRYLFPPKPEGAKNLYHPLRREIIEKIPEHARHLLEKHLSRRDLPHMVVARELAWPTPSATTTALDLASTEVSRQVEAYYETLKGRMHVKRPSGNSVDPLINRKSKNGWVNLSVGDKYCFHCHWIQKAKCL